MVWLEEMLLNPKQLMTAYRGLTVQYARSRCLFKLEWELKSRSVFTRTYTFVEEVKIRYPWHRAGQLRSGCCLLSFSHSVGKFEPKEGRLA
jgi:hypothetical protein